MGLDDLHFVTSGLPPELQLRLPHEYHESQPLPLTNLTAALSPLHYYPFPYDALGGVCLVGKEDDGNRVGSPSTTGVKCGGIPYNASNQVCSIREGVC